METKEIFAHRITEVRKEKGLNQAQLAEKTGISRTSANLYESAARVPDIQVLARYAEVLGVTSDYLIGLSDNRTSENAVTGAELGLADETISELRNYQEIRAALHELLNKYGDSEILFKDFSEIDKELIDTTPELQFLIQNSNILGNSAFDIFENVWYICDALNKVTSDPKLLRFIGRYFADEIDVQLSRYAEKLYLLPSIISDTPTPHDIERAMGEDSKQIEAAIAKYSIQKRLEIIHDKYAEDYLKRKRIFMKADLREIVKHMGDFKLQIKVADNANPVFFSDLYESALERSNKPDIIDQIIEESNNAKKD